MIAPFRFSTEHRWILKMPFWLSSDDFMINGSTSTTVSTCLNAITVTAMLAQPINNSHGVTQCGVIRQIRGVKQVVVLTQSESQVDLLCADRCSTHISHSTCLGVRNVLHLHVLTHSEWRPQKYIFPRGNKPLLYHQIGNTNFFIFITNQ